MNFNQFNHYFYSPPTQKWSNIFLYVNNQHWIYRSRAQKQYQHCSEFQAFPNVLPKFTYSHIPYCLPIAVFVSYILYFIKIHLLYPAIQFFVSWKDCRPIQCEPQDNRWAISLYKTLRQEVIQFLWFFYLDRSVFVIYVCRIVFEIVYLKTIIRELIKNPKRWVRYQSRK